MSDKPIKVLVCNHHAANHHRDSFFTPVLKEPTVMKEKNLLLEKRVPKILSPDESDEKRSVYSFQLAKFLSQLIASRRRKTPVHLDGEERRKRRLKVWEGGRDYIPAREHGPVCLIT